MRDLDDAPQVHPNTVWPTQIADALRALIHHANLAREQGLDTIPAHLADPLHKLFRHGVLVGLSATTRGGSLPGQRKARLLLEVLRDREADVLRFTRDLKVPPTSNQAERDLRPAKVQQNISGRLTSENEPRTATPSAATYPPPSNTATTRSPPSAKQANEITVFAPLLDHFVVSSALDFPGSCAAAGRRRTRLTALSEEGGVRVPRFHGWTVTRLGTPPGPACCTVCPPG